LGYGLSGPNREQDIDLENRTMMIRYTTANVKPAIQVK
jgi:hypothetical protein